MKLRYVDFLAAGVVIAYTASMTLGIVHNGPARLVTKQDCDSYLYPYDKQTTPCTARQQDRGWPFVTNQVYTDTRPINGGVYPKNEFVAPRCGKRCGDVVSWNGLLGAVVLIAPAAWLAARDGRNEESDTSHTSSPDLGKKAAK